MHYGKQTCESLKSIRKKLAEANGIDYQPHECSHEGPCPGTCPLCDRELQQLQQQMEQLEKSGVQVCYDVLSPMEKQLLLQIGMHSDLKDKKRQETDTHEDYSRQLMGIVCPTPRELEKRRRSAKTKKTKHIIGVIVVGVIVLLAGGGIWGYHKHQQRITFENKLLQMEEQIRRARESKLASLQADPQAVRAMELLEERPDYQQLDSVVSRMADSLYVEESILRDEADLQQMSAEASPDYYKIIQQRIATAKKLVKTDPPAAFTQCYRCMGSCHGIWHLKKHIYKEKYGIDWYSPAELHPNIIFD